VIYRSISAETGCTLPQDFTQGLKIDICCQNCIFSLSTPLPVSSMQSSPTTPSSTHSNRASLPCLLSFGITSAAIALRDYERLTPSTADAPAILKKRQWMLTALQHPSQVHAATHLNPVFFVRHTTRHPHAVQFEINVLSSYFRSQGVDVTLVLPILILQNTRAKGSTYNVTQPEMVYAIYATSDVDFADTSQIGRIQESCPRMLPLMSSICELHSTQATIISRSLMHDNLGIRISQPAVSALLIRGLKHDPGPISDLVALVCNSTEVAQSITGAFLASVPYGSELIICTSHTSFPPISSSLFSPLASSTPTAPAIEIIRTSVPYGRRSFLHNKDIRVTSRFGSDFRPRSGPSRPHDKAPPAPPKAPLRTVPDPSPTTVDRIPSDHAPARPSGSVRGNTHLIQPGRSNRGGRGHDRIYTPSILPTIVPLATPTPPVHTPATSALVPTPPPLTFPNVPITHSVYSLSTSSPILTQPTAPLTHLVRTSNDPVLAGIISQANTTSLELNETRCQLRDAQAQLAAHTRKLDNIEALLCSIHSHLNPIQQPSSSNYA